MTNEKWKIENGPGSRRSRLDGIDYAKQTTKKHVSINRLQTTSCFLHRDRVCVGRVSERHLELQGIRAGGKLLCAWRPADDRAGRLADTARAGRTPAEQTTNYLLGDWGLVQSAWDQLWRGQGPFGSGGLVDTCACLFVGSPIRRTAGRIGFNCDAWFELSLPELRAYGNERHAAHLLRHRFACLFHFSSHG